VPVDPLGAGDKEVLALADTASILSALNAFTGRAVPPWLTPTNAYQDGTLPPPRAPAVIASEDLIEIVAVRGPLHALDGWSYIGRALNALISGDAHAARHLAYYAELRAALSILASSGIGIFNKRNFVIDSTGAVHSMTERHTHDMCWASVSEWALSATSLDQLIKPLTIAGTSLLEPFREFFPSGASVAAGYVMSEWGFDLAQGGDDRDARNWSSYQPTALLNVRTTPTEDMAFLEMFWNAIRPGGIEVERHLMRILLEAEARNHNEQLTAYADAYSRLDEAFKGRANFDFLIRNTEPVDHPFLVYASDRTLPAKPYSMICRAALLLRLATGMAEQNLISAGLQPTVQFEAWWKDFGASHGLWEPGAEPETLPQLWDDIDLALEDATLAPTTHRHRWVSALAGSAMRMCETERAALWGLFQ
jgi:hypothetical protein